jgi:hypothetical protein
VCSAGRGRTTPRCDVVVQPAVLAAGLPAERLDLDPQSPSVIHGRAELCLTSLQRTSRQWMRYATGGTRRIVRTRTQTHDRLAAVDSFNIQTRKRSVPAGTVNPSLSNFLNRQQSKINKPHDKGPTNTLIGWRTRQPPDRSIRSWWLGDGCVRRRFSTPIGDSPQSANRCTRLACAETHRRGRRTRSWHRTRFHQLLSRRRRGPYRPHISTEATLPGPTNARH